ncbi:hypothetical protein PybrP1_012530 [[Pythium] brassicae (nom. inval.)]|nr:hypothetical protein PybrP1_012530 [[Pythium] brassicae (nom. inval.)]
MLAMVNGADLRASEQENFPEHKSIPVPVLVRHEEYAAAAAAASADADSTFGGARAMRGPLALATNTIGNLSSLAAASADASAGTESDSSASRARKEKRSTKSKCPPGLRSGKWTPEEEAFTNMIIHYFKRGLLNIEDGTSLRWYLAKRLNCEAMRVTKKLKGNSSIGKQIFRALENSDENQRAIKHAAEDLAIVETLFLDSLAATAAAPPPTDFTMGLFAARAKKSPPGRAGGSSAKHAGSRHGETFHLPGVRAASEDAKLLLHFFEGVHETVPDDDDAVTNVDAAAADKKKRLFSAREPSRRVSDHDHDARAEDDDDETEDDEMATPPPSKRIAIENLMG